MKIQLPKDPLLVQDFKYNMSSETTDDMLDLEMWLSSLCRALEDLFRKAHRDFNFGTSRFRIVSSIPGTSDLEEGEIILYDDKATTRRLYVKMNSSIRYVNLT